MRSIRGVRTSNLRGLNLQLQKQIDSVKAAREQMATLERRCAEADVTIRRMETHGNAHEEMTILRRQLNGKL